MQKVPRLASHDERAQSEALVDAAVAGVPAAIAALLRELSPEVARVARTILGPNDMAVEDTIQDALWSLIHALPSFRRDCSIRRYANRIAARTALLARSRSRALRQRESRFYLDDVPAAYIDGRPDLQHRRKVFVHRMFDELPQAQAEVIALRFLLGYSLEEIAEAVGAPLNTSPVFLASAQENEAGVQLETMFAEHAEFVWRMLRHPGIAAADIEDALHEVLAVVHSDWLTIDSGHRSALGRAQSVRV